MRLFLSGHYHLRLPLFLIYKLKSVDYNSEEFVNWYLKLPDIKNGYTSGKLKSKRDLFYIFSGYYFWIFYIICCFIVVSQSPLIAIVSGALSPFILAGYYYSMAYLIDIWRKISTKFR